MKIKEFDIHTDGVVHTIYARTNIQAFKILSKIIGKFPLEYDDTDYIEEVFRTKESILEITDPLKALQIKP